MKKIIISIAMLIGASLMFISCGAPAANNSVTNKPANATNTATAPTVDKAAVEADIRKMMDDFAAALNKGDADALGKMYADDYTLIDQNGVVQTKAARVEAVKSGKMKMEGMKFEDLKIKTNPTGDGAVVTGHVTGKTTMEGKSEDRNSMVTWVLGKSKDKGWQFVNAQITDIKAGMAAKPTDDKKAEEKKTDAAPAANK
jgi:ketosteroid isomerase-like protein